MILESIMMIIIILYTVNYYKLPIRTYAYIFISSYLLSCLLLNKFQNLILIGVSIIILIFLSQSMKKLHALFITTSTLLVSFLANILQVVLCYKLFNMDIDNARESIGIYSLIILIGTSISLIIAIVIRSVLKKNMDRLMLSQKYREYIFMSLALVLTVAIFYVNFILFSRDDDVSNEQIILNSLLYFLYFGMLIFIYRAMKESVKRKFEIENRDNELKNLKEYTENIETLYSEMRKFRHDYTNILASLTGYIDNNNMDGLKNYFQKDILGLNEAFGKRNDNIGILKNIKIIEIKGLIASKLIKAQKLNIETRVEVIDPINEININIISMCRILGILLDNAIDAAQESVDKQISIALINSESSVVLIVSNSVPENMAPIHKIFKKGFSTKGENRGIGLSNLKEILSSYSKSTIETKMNDGVFTQTLKI